MATPPPKRSDDFTDVSDVPEEYRDGVQPKSSTVSEKADTYADLVIKYGKAYNVKQVRVIAFRDGLEIPELTTLRTYLNTAVKAGKLTKPTRTTYSVK